MPSWPDGQRTTDNLTNAQGLVTPYLFPGASGGVPIRRTNVIIAALVLGALIYYVHHHHKRGKT